MKKFAVFVEQTYERYMAVDDEEDARITAQFGAEVTTENAKLQNGNAATAAVRIPVLQIPAFLLHGQAWRGGDSGNRQAAVSRN